MFSCCLCAYNILILAFSPLFKRDIVVLQVLSEVQVCWFLIHSCVQPCLLGVLISSKKVLWTRLHKTTQDQVLIFVKHCLSFEWFSCLRSRKTPSRQYDEYINHKETTTNCFPVQKARKNFCLILRCYIYNSAQKPGWQCIYYDHSNQGCAKGRSALNTTKTSTVWP